MASMAEPPDPMPCALAAILLPALRAHGCHIQKGLFPGTYWVHARTCVFGPFLRAGCAGASWMRGGSLGTSMRAGRRCLTTRAGSVHCRVLPCSDTDACRHCAGDRVGSWATRCLPAVRGRACVVAWAGEASGGSFGAFAPVAIWAIAWSKVNPGSPIGQPWVPDFWGATVTEPEPLLKPGNGMPKPSRRPAPWGRGGRGGRVRTAALVGGRYAVHFLDSASLRADAAGRLGKPVRDPG